MRRYENHRPGRCLARLARWLGFDRNPLCRGTDRIEAALRLVMVVLLVAGVPAAAVVAGRQADHLALNRAHAQQARDHLVTAVLLENAPATGIPDPYTDVQTSWVLARWQPPGQPPRTGQVLAVAGTRQGSTVRTWIDPSGAVTSPPPDHRDITGDVCIAVIATCLVSWLLLLVSGVLVRRALDRRRLNAWEAEWRASGPLWSGRCG
ncbi:MAG: hypothetical protein ACHQCE_03100 [Streptosporangiales bacterium]